MGKITCLIFKKEERAGDHQNPFLSSFVLLFACACMLFLRKKHILRYENMNLQGVIFAWARLRV